ncbi:unnamed protein product [marine sediment metagenome]|uniref:Uncharacterized protein n=1 Tax=marine sediment metagenome TaxID=412755 RepID=X1E2V7_9ZZZZ
MNPEKVITDFQGRIDLAEEGLTRVLLAVDRVIESRFPEVLDYDSAKIDLSVELLKAMLTILEESPQ